MNTFRKNRFLALALFFAGCAFWQPKPSDGRDHKVRLILERDGVRLSESLREEVMDTILETSRNYNIDPFLILAIMRVESHFNPKACSNRGAMGLMQVRSIVVREVAKEMGINPSESGRLLKDHHFNIRVGVHYFSMLIRKFGDVRKALMAYNMGPTVVARFYKNRLAPHSGYQKKVLTFFEDYSQPSS